MTQSCTTFVPDAGRAEECAYPVPQAMVYRGKVSHRRLKPVRHSLAYSVFTLLLDPDALSDQSNRSKLFRYNRWGPISVHDKDYGPRDGTPIASWVREQLHQHGLDDAGAQLRMLTFPRLWGYAFNPLTIHYCYNGKGRLSAILHEVSNTFGQSHGYLIPVQEPENLQAAIHQETRKVFHVSPFIEMACRYQFALLPPSDRLDVLIRQYDAAGDPILLAQHKGCGVPLDDRSLFQALLQFPLMTLKVIGGIHWEALRLWRKGAQFHAKPPLPSHHVTR